MKVTTSLVKQLSIHSGATMRDLRNILAARSPEGALQEHLLTYWYPVPGTTSHEHAFGYVGNAIEPFVRYIVRTDMVAAAGQGSGHHTFLDLYSPNPQYQATALDRPQGFDLSSAALAEVARQRAVADEFAAHFTAEGFHGWEVTLPVVEYMRRLGVLGHLSVMPFGAVHMLLGHRIATPYDATSADWPARADEYRRMQFSPEPGGKRPA